jgi:VWFA-related protein
MALVFIEAANHHCPVPLEFIKQQAAETWRQVREISTDTLASISRVVDYLGKMPGARVLVMASSGFVGGTLEPQQDRIIEKAVHAGGVINALDAKGLFNELTPGERFADPQPARAWSTVSRGYQGWVKSEMMAVPDRLALVDEPMATLAKGTGGLLIQNNNDLYAGFRELGVPPEVTYRMSFNPESVIADGTYHKLKVKLVHSGSYTVEARPGYFAPVETPAADDRQSKLDREVMASDTVSDFPAGLAIQVGKPSTGHRTLSVVVQVDVSKLGFYDARRPENAADYFRERAARCAG